METETAKGRRPGQGKVELLAHVSMISPQSVSIHLIYEKCGP